jgi:hypothetical protein
VSDYIIRPATPDAKNLVFSTWLKCYQANSVHAKRIPKSLFFERHHEVVEAILSRPTTQVLTAAWSEDPEVILGYAVTEPAKRTVHFVYVKPAFRRSGLAAALLADLEKPLIYSHSTFALLDLHRKMEGWVYDPYAAFIG